jgi:serine/threonine protein kinase/Tol biopolymer transport system component
MDAVLTTERLIRFETFEFDRHTLELRKHGIKIKLSGQPMEVLAMLLARPGELVERGELQRRLWPNDTVVEFEHSINAAVKALRRALNDSPDEPRYIETLPRRGYRFICPLAGIEPRRNGDPPPAPAPPAESAKPATPLPSDFKHSDLISRSVSHYRILEKLGGGGMGVVYKAEDTRLGRKVALKFLPSGLAGHPVALARFEREARAASALNHPHICTVHEVGQLDGQPFLVMELMEGKTLKHVIDGGAGPAAARGATPAPAGGRPQGSSLPAPQLLDLAIQIADGLEAAHAAGIIHRDIKPANIFVTKRGDAKILDFGLAKFTSGLVPASPDSDSPPVGEVQQDTPTDAIGQRDLTLAGAAMGTAAYMSPEQARAEVVDARTDLFSFGAVLYEMATGRQAFSGANSAEIRDAILKRQALPARGLNPAVDVRLQAIIEKALEKDREARYQHAAEMLADLKRLKRDSDSDRAVAAMSPSPQGGMAKPPATAVGTPPLQRDASDSQMIVRLEKRHRKSLYALMAGAFVIVAALLYALYRAPHHVPTVSPALEIAPLTTTGDIGDNLEISPDGKFVVYYRNTLEGDRGKRTIWLKQLATDNDIQLVNLGDDQCPGLDFSPDGSYIYFVRMLIPDDTGDLYQIPTLGGKPRKLLAGVSGPPAISPDGQRVAFVRVHSGKSALLIASLDGSGERTLASYEEPQSFTGAGPAWSSDGKTLAIAIQNPKLYLATIAADGGPVHLVPGGPWDEVNDVKWLSGSRNLLVAGTWAEPSSPRTAFSQIYEVPVDGGEVRQITHDLSRYGSLSASADGRSLVAMHRPLFITLQLITPGKESEARTLSVGNQAWDGTYGLAGTADGKIIYTSFHNQRWDIWEMGADGLNPQRLTDTDIPTVLKDPTVSLHGGFIAFEGREGIWRMDMDGGNKKQLTRGHEDTAPAISPDGRWVIFVRGEGGKAFLVKVPSGGGQATELTDKDHDKVIWPNISPDGKWIACMYNGGFAILPLAGGKAAKFFRVGRTARPSFVWSPDGRYIAFINGNMVSGVDNLWEQPMAGGPPKPLTHFTSDQIYDFTWSPHGQLLLSRGNSPADAVLIRNFQ